MGSGHLVDVMGIDVKTRWNSQQVDRTIKIIVVLVSLTNGYNDDRGPDLLSRGTTMSFTDRGTCRKVVTNVTYY